ncbi:MULTISPECIES: PTS sugar transporter subunit IIA [Gammaproteobacteria]|uniref:PTS sugar transporter subunit IIA n=1 Tax=Gammaproteobacteria TaxID=1236 RepID=UPI0010FF0EA9|nr:MULTISPECIES: PTS sugar transporter subunit IIA [Gammaproteobacteria]EHA1081401.1 PTS transporter subunit EIIA [Photobacterium damselae]MBA5682394.1 PTS sugar transporter subunit IIA [Photobacterium damselae subsp. damselae]MCG3813037.1 PTS sugar transporter subunit IIA [Photobacterium damselae]MCG3823669.1 PTS sugar transporter subunit IIA [Photobacterium damselae]MCG3880582.1 PTS sugar transporter subunit IIA [Psychrobacter sp. Ps6]
MDLKESLITNNSIQLNVNASDWQSAIRIGTDALVNAGVVEDRYYDAIINAISSEGPYICIHDAFALPHCRPEDGVIKTGFALTVLQTPVLFEDIDEPVDVLITLAGKDSEEHIEGTMQVANLIEFDEDFSKLRACKTPQDVVDLIDMALSQVEIA